MKLLIGIDGGGTKTDMVLCDTLGNVLNRELKSGSNPNDIGLKKSIEILESGIKTLILDYDKNDVISLFAGISGGITGENKENIYLELKRIMGEGVHVQNHSDAINAMSSGIINKDGCVVISGTGSVGFARVNNEIFRVAGYGYLIDKGGSGFDFGRDAIYYALCDKEGRGEKTIITQLIEKQTGDLIKCVESIYKRGKPYIASFAEIVFQAYKKDDNIAKIIVEDNVFELSKTFNALGKIVGGKTCETVLAGSVFKEFDIIREHLLPHLDYKFNFIFPVLPPVYGSVVQAANQEGVEIDDSFKKNFENTLK